MARKANTRTTAKATKTARQKASPKGKALASLADAAEVLGGRLHLRLEVGDIVEESEEGVPEAAAPNGQVPLRVGFGVGYTMNLGNYETARLYAYAEGYCEEGEQSAKLDELYGLAREKVRAVAEKMKAKRKGVGGVRAVNAEPSSDGRGQGDETVYHGEPVVDADTGEFVEG